MKMQKQIRRIALIILTTLFSTSISAQLTNAQNSVFQATPSEFKNGFTANGNIIKSSITRYIESKYGKFSFDSIVLRKVYSDSSDTLRIRAVEYSAWVNIATGNKRKNLIISVASTNTIIRAIDSIVGEDPVINANVPNYNPTDEYWHELALIEFIESNFTNPDGSVSSFSSYIDEDLIEYLRAKHIKFSPFSIQFSDMRSARRILSNKRRIACQKYADTFKQLLGATREDTHVYLTGMTKLEGRNCNSVTALEHVFDDSPVNAYIRVKMATSNENGILEKYR